MVDMKRQQCTAASGTNCDAIWGFDIGYFMFNMIGTYLASGGAEISTDPCMSTDDCVGFATVPPERPTH